MKRWCVCCWAVGMLAAGCQEAPPCSSQAVQEQQQQVAAAQSAETTPFFATTAIPTDSAKYPYNHASSIAQMPGGDLLVVWAAGSAEAAKDTVIVASRRISGQTDWSPPVVVADKPDSGDANPVLFVDDQGIVWLFHVELFGSGNLCLGRVVVQTSANGGATWSGSRPALDAICTMVRNKPIILASGRWVLPAYQEAIFQSQFWVSDDRGQTWQAMPSIFTFPVSNLQPAVVALSDGTLYALMRNCAQGGATWEGRSKDCGRTWSMSQRADLLNPNSGLDMIRIANGRLLLAYNPSEKERTPIAVSVSADEGKTWSPPTTIEAGQPQLSYPSLIQTRDGRFHVVYSHRLNYIQYAEFNMTWMAAGGS